MRASPLLLASLVTLAGCATPAPPEGDRLEGAAARALSEIKACQAREETLPAYQALKNKLPPLDGSAPPAALEANEAKPTADEVPLLVAFHRDGIAPCRKITLDQVARVNPALVPPIVQAHMASRESYDRLVRREISWGEFAKDSYQRTLAIRAELLAVAASIDEQNAISQIREFQHRKKAEAETAPTPGT